MKVSFDWIKDYVLLPSELTCEVLAQDLTMSTVEVESIVKLADLYSDLLVAKVSAVASHPGGENLVVVQCDLGGKEAQVVCGASNVRTGMTVAFAPPGAFVNWHGAADRTQISVTKVKGVTSEGMICAANEIGLGDYFECGSTEILDLTSLEITAGLSLVHALSLDDVIFEIDNKSITNRPDLWGHYGIARELSAIYGRKMNPLPSLSLQDVPVTTRVISYVSECRRFTETRITGAIPEQSPFWIRRRLASVGQRPINLLVDLTNYIMLAIGQAAHVFDSGRIIGKLAVRFAKENDVLKLLNQTVPVLSARDLIVVDEEGPVSLAGIMGGGDRSVASATRDIVLEAANFDAPTIRRTATRLALRTESSTRFEKSLDPELAISGVALFFSILHTVQPNAKIASFIDHYPQPNQPHAISVPFEFLDWRLGDSISYSEMIEYLERLGFTVEQQSSSLLVTPPSWRATGDISIPEDVVEEIARLHGYGRFAFSPPRIRLMSAVNQVSYRAERRIKQFLASHAAMWEIYSYPWVEDRFLDAAGILASNCLEIDSPPAPNLSRLQPSLVPQLLRATASNLRYFKDFRIFELNRVFRNGVSRAFGISEDVIPEQPKLVSGALVGTDPIELFRSAKGVLDGIARTLQLSPVGYTKTNTIPWYDRNAQMNVLIGRTIVGHFGVVSLRARLKADIKRSHVVAFELGLDDLLSIQPTSTQFTPIPEYPQVDYDISLVFDESASWEEVRTAAADADPLIKKVVFIDEYKSEVVGGKKKSLTMRLTLGSSRGTLTSGEVDEVVAKVTDCLTKRFGAGQRA